MNCSVLDYGSVATDKRRVARERTNYRDYGEVNMYLVSEPRITVSPYRRVDQAQQGRPRCSFAFGRSYSRLP